MNENDFNQPGSLAYWATVLEDDTTTITMNRWGRTPSLLNAMDNFTWDFLISTPERPMLAKAWGKNLPDRRRGKTP